MCTGQEQESRAEFIGNSSQRAPADLVSFEIRATSQCQASPLMAQESTDRVVEKIHEYLESYEKEADPHFEILVNGGFTGAYSRRLRDKEFCANTFQKSTTVVLKMGMRDDLSQVFSNIQSYLLDNFEQREPLKEGSEIPSTFVSIQTPIPELADDNRKMLEKAALRGAFRDAVAKFKAVIRDCEPSKWKISGMHEKDAYYQPIARYQKAFVAEGATSAPLTFDLIEVSKSLSVNFWFDGSLCYQP